MSVCTPKSFDLTGKVALITGASYGIGFAIATAMANNGATIVFNDIKQELVDKGLAAYKEAGIDAHGYVCDVTNEDAVKALVKQVTEEVGHINILVNNAGIIKRIPMTEMSAAQFRQVIDVDLNAPFIVAKSVIPDMIEQGGGKIINICSMMSELGRETVSAYAAAKGGLKMLTKNIASEYGQYNIQCNGCYININYVDTNITEYLFCILQKQLLNFYYFTRKIDLTSSRCGLSASFWNTATWFRSAPPSVYAGKRKPHSGSPGSYSSARGQITQIRYSKTASDSPSRSLSAAFAGISYLSWKI